MFSSRGQGRMRPGSIRVHDVPQSDVQAQASLADIRTSTSSGIGKGAADLGLADGFQAVQPQVPAASVPARPAITPAASPWPVVGTRHAQTEAAAIARKPTTRMI